MTATLERKKIPAPLLSVLIVLLLMGGTGCKENPAKWPTDRIAAKVAESLELSNLNLSTSERGLEGKGQRSDGETVEVVIQLFPEASKFTWSAKGDRGFVEEGYYELR